MNSFIARAIHLALRNVEIGTGGPFAAVIVRDGKIIAEACNTVTSSNDPTAHAEVSAIRAACAKLNTFQLEGCDLYASCEPCPMCLGAVYWAQLRSVFYAGTRADAAAAGFADDMIYHELEKEPSQRRIPMTAIWHPEAAVPFRAWLNSSNRRPY